MKFSDKAVHLGEIQRTEIRKERDIFESIVYTEVESIVFAFGELLVRDPVEPVFHDNHWVFISPFILLGVADHYYYKT